MPAPFCSVQWAARIEAAECGLLDACARACAARHPDQDVLLREVAGGLAAYTGEGSPLNKLAGLGFGGELDLDVLAQLEAHFAQQGAPLQVEVSTLADPGVAQTLTRRGYALVGFENVLGCALPVADPPPAPAGSSIEEGGDAGTWLDVVVSGFQVPEEQGVASHEEFPREVLERVIADMTSAPGFRRYLARRDGEPVGGASLMITDGIAQLCGSATLPAQRRRGVQTTLLARRLTDAAAAGAELALIITRPGSKSQENAERRGFRLLYPRAVLLRQPG